MDTYDNYNSHHWTSLPTRTDYGTGAEWVTYCSRCGIEDLGDPAEFPDLDYPHCDDDYMPEGYPV